jgi:Family of unknown function (DUF6455)
LPQPELIRINPSLVHPPIMDEEEEMGRFDERPLSRPPDVGRVIRHAELMDRMMERVGIDATAAARLDKGMALSRARSKCLGCCRERQCGDWLAQSEIDASREPPEFCSDAEFFRRLRPKLP